MNDHNKEFLETLVKHYSAEIQKTILSVGENSSLNAREKFIILATIMSTEIMRFFDFLNSFDHECEDESCHHNKIITRKLKENFIEIINRKGPDDPHSKNKTA